MSEPSTSAEPSTSPLSLTQEIVETMIKEIISKLQEEKIFSKDVLGVLLNLKPSKKFVEFVNKIYVTFSNKHNQDKMLAVFYREIVKEWKTFFPNCDNQRAVNLLLIHFPQKLVSYYKRKESANKESQPEAQVCM